MCLECGADVCDVNGLCSAGYCRQVTAEALNVRLPHAYTAGTWRYSEIRVKCEGSTLLLCHVWTVLCFKDCTRVGNKGNWVEMGWYGMIPYPFFSFILSEMQCTADCLTFSDFCAWVPLCVQSVLHMYQPESLRSHAPSTNQMFDVATTQSEYCYVLSLEEPQDIVLRASCQLAILFKYTQWYTNNTSPFRETKKFAVMHRNDLLLFSQMLQTPKDSML